MCQPLRWFVAPNAHFLYRYWPSFWYRNDGHHQTTPHPHSCYLSQPQRRPPVYRTTPDPISTPYRRIFHPTCRIEIRYAQSLVVHMFCLLAFSGDTTFSAQENLRSLMGVIMDGTRQMDQLISNMRNILAETDDTTFETRKDEDNTPSALPTSRSMRIPLGERLPPLFTAAPISPSPYPSPSPSPSARLDRPLRTPAIRRTRVTSPLSTVNQIGETAKSSGTPGYNGMTSLIFGAFDSADPSISDPGFFGSLGSPVFDPFTVGEGG